MSKSLSHPKLESNFIFILVFYNHTLGFVTSLYCRQQLLQGHCVNDHDLPWEHSNVMKSLKPITIFAVTQRNQLLCGTHIPSFLSKVSFFTFVDIDGSSNSNTTYTFNQNV